MPLHIRHVSKTYPSGVQAVRDVSLTLSAGVCGIVGPRDAGKTTLMRMLAGLQDPDAGSIHLGRLDARLHREEYRKRLSYLAQDFMAQTKASADRLLEGHPSLVLLDEPGVGLQPSQRARFASRARDLAGRTVIIVATERIEEIAEGCTRLLVLHEGRIVLDVDPPRAVHELSGRVWHRVISAEALPRVEREYSVIGAKPVAGGIAVRVYSHTPPAVGFEQDDPGLEDVYCRALRQATHPAPTVKEPLLT